MSQKAIIQPLQWFPALYVVCMSYMSRFEWEGIKALGKRLFLFFSTESVRKVYLAKEKSEITAQRIYSWVSLPIRNGCWWMGLRPLNPFRTESSPMSSWAVFEWQSELDFANKTSVLGDCRSSLDTMSLFIPIFHVYIQSTNAQNKINSRLLHSDSP